MKHFLSTLTLLLAFLLLATACAPYPGNFTTTESNSEASPEDTAGNDETQKNQGIYGYWYCKETSAVLELIEGKNEAKFYSLAIGYYAYYAINVGTYTFENDTVSLVLNGETFAFKFDEAADTLTLKEFVYVRETEAPTEHPSYDFPDFSKISFPAINKLITPDKVDITSYLEEARLDIFHAYYSSSIEEYREITDRPARRGDYVNVDYIGYHNGVAFQGGSANASMIPIIENSGYTPGFAEGIIGHKAGETFDVNVTFPKNYGNTTLAGQPVTFKMTLNAIYDITLTDEQFATYENIEYETYEEYVMAKAKEKSAESIFTLATIQSGISEVIPDEAYLYFYQYQVDEAHYMANYYNLPYETYLSYFGLSETSMTVKAKTVALDYIVAFHVAKINNLTWTEEQYQKQYDLFLKDLTDAGYTKDEAIEYMNEKQVNYLTATLTYEIAFEWFVNQVFSNQ